MKDIRNSLSLLLKLGLFLAIPYSLWVQDYLFIFGALSALTLALLPCYWHKSLKIQFPFGIDLLVSCALFAHIILGEIFRFYDHHWYFDKIMHFFGTAIIALLGFLTVFTLHWSKKIQLSINMIAYFTVIFAVAIGSFWEIGEFTVDQLFKRNTQYSLENTMLDMIFNFLGGLIVAWLGSIYFKRLKKHEKDQITQSLQKLLNTDSY